MESPSACEFLNESHALENDASSYSRLAFMICLVEYLTAFRENAYSGNCIVAPITGFDNTRRWQVKSLNGCSVSAWAMRLPDVFVFSTSTVGRREHH
jgi:hypothetical protein